MNSKLWCNTTYPKQRSFEKSCRALDLLDAIALFHCMLDVEPLGVLLLPRRQESLRMLNAEADPEGHTASAGKNIVPKGISRSKHSAAPL